MTWVFDPNHSQVLYACRYLGLSLITGSFQDVKAEADVESSNPGQWSVSAEIDAASAVSPGYPRREEALRGENFLDAEKFPTVTFRSTRIERDGDRLRLTGQLTLHGVTRDVTLVGHDNGEAIDRRGIRRRGFDAETTINRLDFGIHEGTAGVAEEVHISLEVQLVWEES
jgi:polyisoprenoid-binding protein YceI